MGSQQRSFGAALENKANEICRIGEALGPVTLVVDNRGDNEVVLSVSRLSDGALIPLDDDVALTSQAIGTGYTGNTTLLDFTGKAVTHKPIVPGSVTVTPTAGGTSVNSTDKDGDGKLYAYYTGAYHLCGTVDYFTGAIDLHYPTGKAPNTGAITANYSYSSESVKPLAKVSKRINNLPPTATYLVKAAAKNGAGSSQVRVDGFISF
jgi:hypothetical protein